MQLTEQAFKQFKSIYLEDNPNGDITDEELRDKAVKMLCGVKAIYKPIPVDSTGLVQK